MKNIIKKVDLFGKPFIFEERENQKFTTYVGSLFTFLIIITCIVCGYLFGKEIYLRKNPSVLTSDEIVDVSRLNMSEFPIFFTFINSPGIYLDITKHIKMEISLMEIFPDLSYRLTYFDGYKKCDVSEYSDTYQPYVQKLYKDFENKYVTYCINEKEFYIQNNYMDPNSAYVNVRFRLCNQEKEECGDLAERDKIMNDLNILSIYIDSFVDSSNYSNPINYFTSINSQKVSTDLLQRVFLSIEKQKLITHKGWLLENIMEEEVFRIKKITKEVSTSHNGNIFWFTIESPTIRSKTIRSYMKIQDLIAKIGGFFNGLFIAVYILSKNYIDFSFYSYIYNHFVKISNHNNNPNSSKTLNGNHTIDKIVLKYTINSMNCNNKKSDLHNNVQINPFQNINNDISKNNIVNENNNMNNEAINNKPSNNNNQLINNFVKNNNIDDNEKSNINNLAINNNLLNNKIDDNINNSVNVNSNINNVNKDSSYVELKKQNDIENNEYKLKNVYKSSGLNSLQTFDPTLLSKLVIEKEMKYFRYLFQDVCCCRKKFSFHMKAVTKIISFINLLDVNYNYFLKNHMMMNDY